MKTIYIVRHAITIENEKGISQGHKFGTISETGYKQIEHLANHFKTLSVDMIISSDLARCQITARELEKTTKAPVLYSPSIREIARGDWEGTQKTQKDYDTLPGKYESRKAPNGESLEEVLERAKQFWNEITEFDQNNILIVSHGGFLKLLIGHLLGMSVENSIKRLSLDNCSLTMIRYENNTPKVKLLNDTGHLP